MRGSGARGEGNVPLALVLGRVIGDVVDVFSPSVAMSVAYNGKQLSNGCECKPSAVSSPPLVSIGGADLRSFFTLVMTDPDSPNPSDPTMREYLHWVVTDIPGTTSSRFGRELVAYEAPKPVVGIHRYVMTLFKQSGGRDAVKFKPLARPHFNTRNFARINDLGHPVAAFYFNSQKEPSPSSSSSSSSRSHKRQ
uniref:FT/TFL1-like protein n=1 Tax=Ephedra przewalskii TaxID=257425 RepID=A0A1B1LTG9_9SPER|nr:FT/TFL1-like protein [Ephedra przewalskii]